MRVLHVPYCYRPDPIGGTEVYVETLAHELQRLGVSSAVAAPGRQTETYAWEGMRVHRYYVDDQPADVGELYGAGDPAAAQGFERVLEDTRPDVVHFHAYTRGVSLRCQQASRRRRIPVVVTYHTPAVSCQRGTLLRWGSEVCDGRLEVTRCASCALQGLGMSRAAGTMLAQTPPRLGRLVGAARRSGGAWTALRMTDLLSRHHGALRAHLSGADRVVVVSRWTQDVLLRNGVPAEKIVLSRHGLPESTPGQSSPGPARGVAEAPPAPPLRVAYLGRLDPIKGLDVLLRAVRAQAAAPLTLDVYGVAQGAAGERYRAELAALAGDDPRITFRQPVPSAEVTARLAGYHLVAVPSLCLETGPLVALEAFAAGVAVLGSNLGGIAELVTHDVDGLLLTPGAVEEWGAALSQLAGQPETLARLRAGVRPPRRMRAVAEEMRDLYAALVAAA